MIPRIFNFMSSKSDKISSPFLCYKTPFHAHHIIRSTRHLNFPSYLSIYFVNQCLLVCIFHFSKISSKQFVKDTYQRLESLLLRNTLIAFIKNTPWNFTTSSTTFWTFSSTPSADWFEIFILHWKSRLQHSQKEVRPNE